MELPVEVRAKFKSRSARTARIEIGAIANLLGSILVAVRKDRED